VISRSSENEHKRAQAAQNEFAHTHEPDDKREGKPWQAPFIKELQMGGRYAILATLLRFKSGCPPG
jgi:hypothetical protein